MCKGEKSSMAHIMVRNVKQLVKVVDDLQLNSTLAFHRTSRKNQSHCTAGALSLVVSWTQENPECGFLGGHVYVGRPTLLVQYWRSFDQLHDYAR